MSLSDQRIQIMIDFIIWNASQPMQIRFMKSSTPANFSPNL